MGDIVEKIVEQLGRGGILNDPRPLAQRTTPLEDHVRAEVRRSWKRVLEPPELPPDFVPSPEAQRAMEAVHRTQRAYVKALRQTGLPALAAGADRVENTLWQEPPPRSNTRAYLWAAEVYDLMTWFSAKPPTGYAMGPFRTMVRVVFELDGAKPVENCERAASYFVLKSRHRHT
jgi:hypothetical protein